MMLVPDIECFRARSPLRPLADPFGASEIGAMPCVSRRFALGYVGTMDAIRCVDCGDVRWSLMGLKGKPGKCTMCGGEMVPERRRPASGNFASSERRDLVAGREAAGHGARPTV